MFQDAPHLIQRQLWGLPTSKTSSTAAHCTPYMLSENGVLSFANSAITLTTNVLFQPKCTGSPYDGISTVGDLEDPFYASTIPQTYVIAATTVIAWILVVMLVITPRTAFFGSSATVPAFGNGHGIIGGATGGHMNLIGVGSRPWLQKLAALTVAVSLTIATADTFRAAAAQYHVGYMNAEALRTKVMGSLEIRVTRVISDVFVWLAQVQTLIRLFPRHKEKVLIKWIGFALIIFDSVFSCLNAFLVGGTIRPRHFVDAIPALSYLFELSLGLLYAAWVIYYALTKRRYAFYHPKMRNICLVAVLSLIAVLTPVVFFVTDVSNSDVAGWGDYFRWVGAAAASVVVWEWVERIEALERDGKKDGILGREIFDGDEMLDETPSGQTGWSSGGISKRRSNDDPAGGNQTSALEKGVSHMVGRFRKTQQQTQLHFPLGRAHSATTATPTAEQAMNGNGRVSFGRLPKPGDHSDSSEIPIIGPTVPAPVASPVNRVDTNSAASTVYVVRYDTITDAPQPVRRRVLHSTPAQNQPEASAQGRKGQLDEEKEAARKEVEKEAEEELRPNRNRDQNKWLTVTNPFKRKRASPPAEVQQAREQAAHASGRSLRSATPAHNFSKWDFKNRLGVLAAETGEKYRDRQAARRQAVQDLPVTIIPAQPRGSGRTWTPDALYSPGAAEQITVSGGDEHVVETARASGTEIRSGLLGSPASPRRVDASPLGAGGAGTPDHVIVTAPPRDNRSAPPRADDISPIAGRNGPTVIVPPTQRRSPLWIDSNDTRSGSTTPRPSRSSAID